MEDRERKEENRIEEKRTKSEKKRTERRMTENRAHTFYVPSFSNQTFQVRQMEGFLF